MAPDGTDFNDVLRSPDGPEQIVALFDAATPLLPPRGCSPRDFVLAPTPAEVWSPDARNSIEQSHASSEKLDAFAMCARYVSGLVDPTAFPLAEAVDRLWATAEAAGLIAEHGEDAVQMRMAEGLRDPLIVDADYPRFAEPPAASEPASGKRRRRPRTSAGGDAAAGANERADGAGKPPGPGSAGDAGGVAPPGADQSDDELPDGPRKFGFSVEALNREYAVVMVGSQAAVFHEQPQARLVEHQVRMLGIDGFKTWFRNRFTEFCGRGGVIKRVTWANAWLDSRDRRQYQGIEFFPDPHNAPGSPHYLNLWDGLRQCSCGCPRPIGAATRRSAIIS